MKLVEDGGDTILSYSANAEVGGKLASVGSRLVEGVAKKQADDFFGKFSDIVGGGQAAVNNVNSTDQSVSIDDSTDRSNRGISPVVWGAGLVIFVGILLYAFAG